MSSFTTIICETCGKAARKKMQTYGPPRFCSRACYVATLNGSGNPNYRTGRVVMNGGYWGVLSQGHPRAKGNHVAEHILLAEKALGRHLPAGVEVHHVDGDGFNNKPNNLVICQDHAYHFLLEARTRRLKETGDLSLKKCRDCGIVKSLSEFPSDVTSWDKRGKYCCSCNTLRCRAYYAKHLSKTARLKPVSV